MHTINTYYEDYESLKKYVIDNKEVLLGNSNRAILVQVFTGICEENYIRDLSKQIRELIPGVQIIGTTTNGEIMNGLVSGLKTVLSFSVFKHSNIKVALAQTSDGNAYELGKTIASMLIGDKTKALILFSTALYMNGSHLLQGVESISSSVPVCGGIAGNNLSDQNYFVFCNEGVTDFGVVGVSIESDRLKVICQSHLGWQTIGKEMTITEADGSRVFMIDHLPAFQVFRKYLGNDRALNIMDSVEFPLIVCRNGLEIARTPATRYDDDSIGFFGDMAEGDKVRFSYGHFDIILEQVRNILQSFKQQALESIFVYSCASRRSFLQPSAQIETLPFQAIAPTSGFFTSGEFYHADNCNQFLNATMTMLALSESDEFKYISLPNPEVYRKNTDKDVASPKDYVADKSVEVLKTLTHLINAVTSELNERTAELEEANQALHLSEERFSKAFHCNPDPLSITTIDEGRYVEVNDAWLNYTGYERHEVIGRTVHELGIWIISGDRDLLINKISEQESIQNLEIPFRTKSGEIRLYLVSAETIEMNQKPHLLFVCKDITKLKQTELQLQEERNFNAVLLDTAGDLIVVCDQQGCIVLFNKMCEQVTGYSLDEVKGRYIGEVVNSPDDANDRKILFNKVKTDWETHGFRQKYENYLTTKDGKRRLISWTITPIIDEHGLGTHAIATGMDITDQRLMEERLRKNEAELRVIIENANGMVYSMSKQGRLNFVSNGCKEALGYDNDELRGCRIQSFVHPDDIQYYTNSIKNVVATCEPQKEIEYRIKHRDGSWRWHSTSLAPVKNDAGHSLFYVGICVDITERKQAEEDILYLSYHDKLTGLYNRTFFEEELKRISTNRQLPIGLIIGDVNGLKLVNDALGHLEGDKVIKQAAEILRKSCRQEDIICRWGGDEFIILLPKCDSRSTMMVYKRISASFIEINSLATKINISLGMAVQTSLDQDIKDVIKEAEENMYRNKLLESRSTRSSFIKTLEKALWEKSHETKDHCQRMQTMAYKIGKSLNLTDSELDELKLLAALHDIGKIAIPNSILDKPGELTPEEWETIKGHPETGYRIALSSPELASVAEAILHHHERWDGSGYPLGLKGNKIPLISRIIAITDAYDVITNGRPYKKAMSKEEALAEIRRCAGTQFDPNLVLCDFFD
ncbi:MAG: PAS domain S-box protein [Syntrophomonas sp.]